MQEEMRDSGNPFTLYPIPFFIVESKLHPDSYPGLHPESFRGSNFPLFHFSNFPIFHIPFFILLRHVK
jgi:hypothetical protein